MRSGLRSGMDQYHGFAVTSDKFRQCIDAAFLHMLAGSS